MDTEDKGYIVTPTLLNNLLSKLGFSGLNPAESVEFRHWQLSKLRLLFNNVINFGDLLGSPEMELAAARTTNKIYIVSPNKLILNNSVNQISCPVRHIDFSNMDTSKIKNPKNLFAGNNSLVSITFGEPYKSHDTSPDNPWYLKESNYGLIQILDNLCFDCTNLKSIDLSGLNLSACDSMSLAFCNCVNLEYVNLGNLPITRNLICKSAFLGCDKLKSDNIIINTTNAEFSAEELLYKSKPNKIN